MPSYYAPGGTHMSRQPQSQGLGHMGYPHVMDGNSNHSLQ